MHLFWSHLLLGGFSLFLGGPLVYSELGTLGSEGEASAIRYAQNFSIEAHGSYQIVSVMHAYEGAGDEIFRYALYPRGNAKPDVGGVDAFVEVPITRAIVLSTTFLGAIDVVGAVDSLVGVGTFNYVNTPSVVAKIDAGSLVEVGSETMKNIELMVSLEPEVIFANIVGSPDYDVHPTLTKMGIVSAVTAAYMERSLLARAEWIKFVGAFYGEDEKAAQFFDTIEEQYLELKALANDVTVRPTVFANAPWGNIWYVPSGTSYIAGLIEDAGADYLWDDIATEGSFPMDFESVYERAIGGRFLGEFRIFEYDGCDCCTG